LLEQAASIESQTTCSTRGRFNTEMANTLKALGVAERHQRYFTSALSHYEKAALLFEQIGNLRYAAAVENNRGYLLLSLSRFQEAETHLERARSLFSRLRDSVGCAQVDETLAQLYLTSEKYNAAGEAIRLAVDTLEGSGEDALLAEALTTQGLVMCRLGDRQKAKPILERARRVAERCGNHEGAGRALLILIEEMCEQLGEDQRQEIAAQASQLLANSQHASTCERLRNCLERIAAAHAEFEERRERATHAEKMAALGE